MDSPVQRIPGRVMAVNSFLVHGREGVVVVDGMLTVSDAELVRAAVDRSGAPLAGVLVTHPHSDHYAERGRTRRRPPVPAGPEHRPRPLRPPLRWCGRAAMTTAATLTEVTSGTRDHTLADRLPHAGLVDTPQLTDVKEQATGSYAPVFAARRYPTPWRDREGENAGEPLLRCAHSTRKARSWAEASSGGAAVPSGGPLPIVPEESGVASFLSFRWSWDSSATCTALSPPLPARCGLRVPLGPRGLGIFNGGALRVLTSCDPRLVIAAALAITGSSLLPASDDTDVPSRPPKPRLGVPRQEPLNPTSLQGGITQ